MITVEKLIWGLLFVCTDDVLSYSMLLVVNINSYCQIPSRIGAINLTVDSCTYIYDDDMMIWKYNDVASFILNKTMRGDIRPIV